MAVLLQMEIVLVFQNIQKNNTGITGYSKLVMVSKILETYNGRL